MTANEVLVRVAVFIASYRTKDLDRVNDAYIYRISYALLMVRAVLWWAINVLHLW